jgi:FtsH-binding integral membrane protein
MVTEANRRVYEQRYGAAVAGAEAVQIDVGLRQYMLRVYNYMGSGLLLSGIVAMLVANTGARDLFFLTQNGAVAGYTGLGMIAVFAPIGLILAMSFGANKMTTNTLQVMYWSFVALMGVGLSVALLMYTGVSVARVFFITAISFGGLSLYGYLTKRDLSVFRTFLIMGLIGLLITMVVQIFVQSTALHFIYSAVGVLLFAGLTAYDTQAIKNTYSQVQNSSAEERSAVMGAVRLYLDFINLFMFLLQFLGARRG